MNWLKQLLGFAPEPVLPTSTGVYRSKKPAPAPADPAPSYANERAAEIELPPAPVQPDQVITLKGDVVYATGLKDSTPEPSWKKDWRTGGMMDLSRACQVTGAGEQHHGNVSGMTVPQGQMGWLVSGNSSPNWGYTYTKPRRTLEDILRPELLAQLTQLERDKLTRFYNANNLFY